MRRSPIPILIPILATVPALAAAVPAASAAIAPDYVAAATTVATKTPAPLVDVPQSASVVTRDRIDLLNAVDVARAARYVAGVGAGGDGLTVRGFAAARHVDGVQAATGSVAGDSGIDLYAFKSVEIVKGPVSALYGGTPPGGLYNLVSRRPQAAFGGEVQARGGDGFDQVAGTVTGLVTNGARARVTALYRTRDGGRGSLDTDRLLLAPALAVDLGPDTVLTMLGQYQRDRVPDDAGAGAGRDRRRQFSAGYDVVRQLSGKLWFTQVARWSGRYGAAWSGEDDAGNVAQFAVDSRLEATAWTGPVQHALLAGVDRRNRRAASATGVATGSGASFTNRRLRQTGVYVQDQLKLNRLILTLSGRQDRVRSIDRDPVAGLAARAAQDRFSHRIGMGYVTDLGVAPYLGHATSFQPGPDARGFAPTAAGQWEAGVRYDARGLPPDVRLFASAALYRLRQRDVATRDPGTGRTTVTGVELEATARFRDRLSLDLAYSHADTGGARSSAGASPQPRDSAAAFVDWSFRGGALAGFGLGGGVRHLSRAPAAPGAATLFDAVLRYDFRDWRLALDATGGLGRDTGCCAGDAGCVPGRSRQVTATLTRRF